MDQSRMSGALPRGLKLIETLVGAPAGLGLTELAAATGISKAAVHRSLGDLMLLDYVVQDGANGRYRLSLKLFSIAFQNVSGIDIVGIAQPVIEDLARQTSELVRLSLVDGDRLVCVAKAQGSTRGLRFDDDLGAEANLYLTATGAAWMACLSDDEAFALVDRQGAVNPEAGPGAPTSREEYRSRLDFVREHGYAWVRDSNEVGIAGVAAPVLAGNDVVGVLTVVGPTLRMNDQKMQEDSMALLKAARDLNALYIGNYPDSAVQSILSLKSPVKAGA